MRIALPMDYGYLANATSLNLIPKKLFFELGKIMNSKKSFTISATLLKNCGIGDINKHYDCVDISNMGGFRFPPQSVLNCKNLFIGLIGIDEVILGRKSFRSERHWAINKPIINEEIKKWENQINKIKLVHVATNSEKQQMIEYLKIPKEKLHIIPLGVDHKTFKPAEDKEKARQFILGKYFLKNEPYFIHISEVNWARKNIFNLFNAFKKARNAGIKQNLIIVGKNETIVFSKAKEIPGVIMTGFVPENDLVKFIQGSDGLLNPSLHEGFGLPLLESMACKIPILTSNVFSPPEVVKDGGLFVNPYDIDEISKEIISLATDENLRESLSENGYRRSQDFSWEFTAHKLLELLEQHTPKTEFNFEESIDLAALRTLATMVETHPILKTTMQHKLLKFEYNEIINWASSAGLNDPFADDFLHPFKHWLEINS